MLAISHICEEGGEMTEVKFQGQMPSSCCTTGLMRVTTQRTRAGTSLHCNCSRCRPRGQGLATLISAGHNKKACLPDHSWQLWSWGQ